MQIHRSLHLMVMLLTTVQIVSPAALWAAESQRAVREGTRRIIVSGLHGETLAVPPDPSKESRLLRFRESIGLGDLVTTGSESGLEMLVGRYAFVTVHEDSTLQFLEETPGQITMELRKGEVRLAVARTEETVTVRTSATTAVIRGGLIRIRINPGKRRTLHEQRDGMARPLLTDFAQITPPSGQSETFQVMEGMIQIKSTAPAAPLVTVEAGQSVQVMGGQVGKPLVMPTASEPGYSLPAVEPHAYVSQTGLQHLAALQQRQAEALQRVVLGPNDTELAEANNVANGAILSTTGIIISTTGAALIQSQERGTSATLFASGSLFSGAALTNINRTGTGVVDDNGGQIQILLGTSGGKPFSVRGGPGLLVFDRHTIQTRSELLIVDSGDTSRAPHIGVPPPTTLYLTPSPLLSSTTPRLNTAAPQAPPGQPLGVPMQIASASQMGGGSQSENINRNVEVFVGGPGQNVLANLRQFSRDTPQLVPDPQGFNNSLVIRARLTGPNGSFNGFENPNLTTPPPNTVERSLVDGVIRARNNMTAPVALGGGVTLNNTRMTASAQDIPFDQALPQALQAPANATRQYFAETSQLPAVNATIVGVIARKDATNTLRPALATFSDRTLAVLDGSTLAPDNSTTRISLLSVLDSQLTGPTTIPSTRVGQDGRSPGIPPLMEIINSNPPLSNPSTPGVQVTSAVVVRASGALNGILPVDRGLLEATSPLVVMMNSTMATASHFADFSGVAPANSRGLLNASLVPGDALIRLDGSSLTVMGNLFHLANGARASVTGHLFSLINNSSLTVNGALVNLADNSVLNLISTTFGVFGTGANRLTINNNFCASACTAIAGFPELRVSGGGTVTLPAGFTPFALVPGASVPRVTIAPNAAAFQVSPQAQFNIILRQ